MPAASLSIVPRRVTVTSGLILFTEPRFAWRVQTEAPFVVKQDAEWRIIGVSHARSEIQYETESNAAPSTAQVMYAAAEEAAVAAADWPVIRWIPLDGDLSEGALDPRHVAFTLEDATARTAENEAKAGGKKPRAPRRTSLGRGLHEIRKDASDVVAE